MSEWAADVQARTAAEGSISRRAMVRFAAEHGAHAEIREEGDVALFCECTVPDGEGRRLACEIHVVTTFQELRAVLGY